LQGCGIMGCWQKKSWHSEVETGAGDRDTSNTIHAARGGDSGHLLHVARGGKGRVHRTCVKKRGEKGRENGIVAGRLAGIQPEGGVLISKKKENNGEGTR